MGAVSTPDEARTARAMGLLGALATASAQGHTDATLGQRLADVLGEALPLACVELHEGARVRSFVPARRDRADAVFREAIEVPTEEGVGRLVLVFAAPPAALAREFAWSDAWRDALARVIAVGFAQVGSGVI
jgi:hypothetical protein